VALMIEKKAAVEDLDAILSVPGVDMVQFGPADYAMSIGLAGQWDHPAVREAERFVVDTAIGKGIAPRAEIGDPAEAKRHLDMGVRHFCMGWDMTTLYQWFAGQGAALRDVLGVPHADAGAPGTSGYGAR